MAALMTIPTPANDRVPSKIGPGALVLVVGPSGAGKDTLIGLAREALAGDETVVFPRRIVTRAVDETEDSEAVSRQEYDILVGVGRTALHWEAHGLAYAVPIAAETAIVEGRIVVVNVSRGVIPQAVAKYQRVTVVFVTAPKEVLAARLVERGRESEADIRERLERSAEALPPAPSLVMIQNVGDASEGARRLVEVIRDLEDETR